jgi:hypothetical protein
MKKLLTVLLMLISSYAYCQLDTTNIGTTANDGTGESLRSAFLKVNLAVKQVNTNTDSLKLKLNKSDAVIFTYPGAGIPLSTGSAWGTSITNNSTNWNTAYTDRLKWDGGSTGLVAATGRSSLGGTTAGQALFTLTNPSAITFLRVNADNTVTALSAANFRTATATVGTTDTAAMLTPYITTDETSAMIGDTMTARLSGATDLATVLADYVAESDTAAMLTDYINKADTATMLTPYARKKSPTFNTVVKLDSDTLATRAYARSYGGTGTVTTDDVKTIVADSAVKLSDIRPYFVFGAGTGAAADSTLFAKGNKSFGSFRIIEDSLYIHSITNLYMTSGDSLKFNVYYGNGMTRTATDSLFTAPQGAGSYASQTFTPNNERTINHGHDVWVGIIGPQPANKRPKEWVLQLNAKIVRD